LGATSVVVNALAAVLGSQTKVAEFTSTSVNILPTTAATNTTSGALVVGGGVGVAGAGFFGAGATVLGANTATQLNIGNNSSPANTGGFLWNYGASNLAIFGGANYTGSQWTARGGTAASGVVFGYTAVGDIQFFTDTGLTNGSAYTPTPRLTISNTGAATFSGQTNFQSTFPQIVFGAGSTAVNQIGFLYSSGGQYVGLSGNRNPNSGVFANTAGTHASIDLDTGAGGSAITFRTTASVNTLGTVALTIGSNQAATFAGLVSTPAATTTTAGLRVPHGAAPTSPVNGDIWTTTAGLYVRINGVTVGPLS